MAFYVGQKVVCVSPFPRGHHTEALPEVGAIYTIRAFDGGEHIWLNEIVNGALDLYDTPGECSWNISGFRPAVEPTQSVFDEYIAPIFNRNRERESV